MDKSGAYKFCMVALNTCRSSVQTLLRVTLLVTTVLEGFLEFWNPCFLLLLHT